MSVLSVSCDHYNRVTTVLDILWPYCQTSRFSCCRNFFSL